MASKSKTPAPKPKSASGERWDSSIISSVLSDVCCFLPRTCFLTTAGPISRLCHRSRRRASQRRRFCQASIRSDLCRLPQEVQGALESCNPDLGLGRCSLARRSFIVPRSRTRPRPRESKRKAPRHRFWRRAIRPSPWSTRERMSRPTLWPVC